MLDLDHKISCRADIRKIIYTTTDDSGRYFIMRIDEETYGDITVKGPSNFDLREDGSIRFKAEEGEYKGARQLVADFIYPDVDLSNSGAHGWLKTLPVRGLGPVASEKVRKAFPDNLNEVLSDPGKVAEHSGIREAVAQSLADAWVCLDTPGIVLELFNELEIPMTDLMKALKLYGSKLETIMRENPWDLAKRVSGIGFYKTDAIAERLGVDMKSSERYAAAIRHVIHKELPNSGDTMISHKQLHHRLGKLGVNGRQKIDEMLESLVADKSDIVLEEQSGMYGARATLTWEAKIPLRIRELCDNTNFSERKDEFLDRIHKAEEKLGLTLDESQREAALTSLMNPVSIITGGPGTGKSTTQAVILAAVAMDDSETISLMAPTGRAAKRLGEATGGDGQTIHRGLAFDPIEGQFTYCRHTRLPDTTLIVDEFSMVDAWLSYSLFDALRTVSRIVIVGDDQQLSSVGPGQVLADMIRSEVVPVSRLKVIHRQAEESGIIKAAHAINSGEEPEINDRDVFFRVESDEEDLVQEVLDLLTEELPGKGIDPTEEVMVLTPQKKGPLGSDKLNETIKDILNPAVETRRDHSMKFAKRWFSVGDKVMHLRNDYEKYVFNGTVGRVVECLPEQLTGKKDEIVVDFEGHRVSYTKSDIRDIGHCWASTVHKVQGSETRVAIMVAHRMHSYMLERNLVYTGITRAKELLYFVGQKSAVKSAAKKERASKRVTGLSIFLRMTFGIEPYILENKPAETTTKQEPDAPSKPKRAGLSLKLSKNRDMHAT